MKAALIVQNCIAGDFKKNIESSIQFIKNASQKGADIIVFPEMNLTGYAAGPDIISISKPVSCDMINLFSGLANDLKITILTGLAEKTTNQKIYASHLIFNPNEQYGIYRKIHIAPYEQDYFTGGDKVAIFSSNGFKFGVQLCYDAHFPELSLSMALKKADIIFIPHASPRGSSQQKYDSWTRHLRARAFDNGLYIAACNQTGENSLGLKFPGISILIGPDGNIIYKSIDESQGMHIINIEKDVLHNVRSHKMRYFLPHRRNDLFKI